MLQLHHSVILAIVSGSAGLVLVQAYQDEAHYSLPANIYDNIAPGLTIPTAKAEAVTTAPSLSSTPPQNDISDGRASGIPGPDDPPTIDITTPLRNGVYTPGSGLVMTWSNNGISFPPGWTATKSLMDMVTKDPNFSNSPLLTSEDLQNLARMKLEDLKRATLASMIKDSTIRLHSLRLVSWPLVSSSEHSLATTAATSSLIPLSPSILSNPGYSLTNVSNLVILGGAGGQLSWTIPADWNYEGEFEIRIPYNGLQAKSQSFWILRDADTRQRDPQRVLPSMDQQLASQLGVQSGHEGTLRKLMDHQKGMGIFLGVAAMMFAFILVGLGMMLALYRRNKGGSSSSSSSSSMSDPTTSTTDSFSSSSYASDRSSCSLVQNHHPFHALDHTKGDEDAHSPTDLALSGATLGHCEKDATMAAAAAQGSDRKSLAVVQAGRRPSSSSSSASSSCSPVDASFVELPLYEPHDSTATLTDQQNEKHP